MTSGDQERAIIIGAGPAGLTAAFELLTRTGIKPIVLEKSDYIGGIARMVNYKGKPHRHRRASLLLKIRPCHGLVAEDSSPANV
jgi:protoporphyrinogen oxidase